MDAWEVLNSVYGALYRRSQVIGEVLAEAGFSARWGWYNFHSSLRGGEYQVELFPVPVITVGGWCDLVLELDCICVDAHLDFDQARSFNWRGIPWSFEVYGVEDYTETLYRPGMNLATLPTRVARYGREIGLSIPLSLDCTPETVLEIVAACQKWGTHIK